MLIDNHEELRARYNPDGSDLRRAQLKMLDMLKFIDKVCQEQKITYWLDGGTLLGAARHGGFIPWDDDTDIAMPRKDYKKFKDYMIHHNPSNHYVLQCHKTDKNYYGTWGVLRDLDNHYVQNNNRLNHFMYQGIQVDIFPVDEKSSCKSLSKICRWVFAWLVDAPQFKGRRLKYIRWNVPIAYHFLTKILVPVCRFLTRNDKVHFSHQYGTFWYYRWTIEMSHPTGTIQFEDNSFSAPHDVDAYLTTIYGDWRKLPPEKDRYNHQFGFELKD